ncbi:MAG: hypothetical protein O9346_14315 [Leptospiraceae bacterium]|nr:hypothetical protein [Leptospiraceae bacterium]MCZ8347586.1 hypothetical protein [Leptospiraceae bacterium]
MKDKATHVKVIPSKSKSKKLRKLIEDIEKNSGEFDLRKAKYSDGSTIKDKKNKG